MGQIIRVPSGSELPDGSVRDFVTVMFHLYKQAHRPTLRQISDAIARNEDLAATASPETIRRMLRGAAVPQRWEIVEAVMVTLCDLGHVVPGDKLIFAEERLSIRSHVERLWHRALDYPHAPSVQAPAPDAPAAQVADPWADDPSTNGGDGFPDEPPF